MPLHDQRLAATRPLLSSGDIRPAGKGDPAVSGVWQRLDRVVEIPDVDIETGRPEMVSNVRLGVGFGPEWAWSAHQLGNGLDELIFAPVDLGPEAVDRVAGRS